MRQQGCEVQSRQPCTPAVPHAPDGLAACSSRFCRLLGGSPPFLRCFLPRASPSESESASSSLCSSSASGSAAAGCGAAAAFFAMSCSGAGGAAVVVGASSVQQVQQQWRLVARLRRAPALTWSISADSRSLCGFSAPAASPMSCSSVWRQTLSVMVLQKVGRGRGDARGGWRAGVSGQRGRRPGGWRRRQERANSIVRAAVAEQQEQREQGQGSCRNALQIVHDVGGAGLHRRPDIGFGHHGYSCLCGVAATRCTGRRGSAKGAWRGSNRQRWIQGCLEMMGRAPKHPHGLGPQCPGGGRGGVGQAAAAGAPGCRSAIPRL